MNFLLTLAMKNKLATALSVIILALVVFCGFQYLTIKTLSVRLDVAQNELKAQTAALRALEVEAEILEERIAASKRKIDENRKVYERKLKELQGTPVPTDCPSAVQWGSQEFNSLMENY